MLSAFETFEAILTMLVLLALSFGRSRMIAAKDAAGRLGPPRARSTFDNHPPQAWAAP